MFFNVIYYAGRQKLAQLRFALVVLSEATNTICANVGWCIFIFDICHGKNLKLLGSTFVSEISCRLVSDYSEIVCIVKDVFRYSCLSSYAC